MSVLHRSKSHVDSTVELKIFKTEMKQVDLRPLKVFASEKLPDSALRDAILSQTQDNMNVETFLTILPIYLRLSRRVKP